MLVRHYFEFQRAVCPRHINTVILIIQLVTEIMEVNELF